MQLKMKVLILPRIVFFFRPAGGRVPERVWAQVVSGGSGGSTPQLLPGRHPRDGLHLRGQDHRRLLRRPRGGLSALPRLRSSLRIRGRTTTGFFQFSRSFVLFKWFCYLLYFFYPHYLLFTKLSLTKCYK